MKKFLTVLKFTLLALFLVGLTFAFLFFRVWQKNERPEIISQSWSSSEVVLGHTATLTLEVEAPWHRDIEKATPFAHPDFLAPVPDRASVTKGPLAPNGTRTWTLVVPFVVTDTKSLDGLTASFPVKATQRISPNSLNVELPSLDILTPSEIPETPGAPDSFLTDAKPPEEPEATATPPEDRSRTWLWVLLALLVIALLIYLLKRTGIIKTTPPWEKAMAHLDKLDPNTGAVPFYSKLTDILKQYTSDRFEIRGRSKTSTEFIQVLKNHPEIPKAHLDDLTSFAHLADAVKFADHVPEGSKAAHYLELIRTFVSDTTPKPEEEEKESAPKIPAAPAPKA